MSSNHRNWCLQYVAVALVALSAAGSTAARADGGSGFGQIFDVFFGHEDSRDKSANCQDSDDDQNSGFIGITNNIFCHLENDMGFKGTGSATKTFTRTGAGGAQQSMTVHCDVAANAAGAPYADTASCWVCAGGAAQCGAKTSFVPFLNMSWSYVADKSVNKGALLMDNGAFGGQAGQNAMSYSWDLGTNTANKTMNVTVASTGNNMSVAVQKSGTTLSSQMVMVQGSNQFRFATAVDTAGNLAVAGFEGNAAGMPGSCTGGAGPISSTSTTTINTGANCTLCLSRSRNGDDWAYTPAQSCGSLSLNSYSYPASISTVFGNTASIVLGTWNGMGSNPAAL